MNRRSALWRDIVKRHILNMDLFGKRMFIHRILYISVAH